MLSAVKHRVVTDTYAVADQGNFPCDASACHFEGCCILLQARGMWYKMACIDYLHSAGTSHKTLTTAVADDMTWIGSPKVLSIT